MSYVFNKKYKVNPKTQCWDWTGTLVNGYGRIMIKRKSYLAHRLSYFLFKGDIPTGLYVCHHCDNPSCVNPDHLFLGTPTDNMKDASRKGRVKIPIESYSRDETHQVAKLTNEQVRFIRENPQITGRILSRMFGVTPTAISCARRYKTFRDVK